MKRRSCGPPRFALAIAMVPAAKDTGKDFGLDKHDGNAGTASSENKANASGGSDKKL